MSAILEIIEDSRTITLEIGVLGPQGPAGAAGPAGGPPGPQGPPGATWRDGAGVPANTLGSNGDYYLNDTTGAVYQKQSGSYVQVASLKGATGSTGPTGPQGPAGGPQGPAGAPGAVWRNATGAPANIMGIDGDYYLDSATGNVYRRTAGSYAVVANIQGQSGSVWRDGSGVPANGTGVDGDYYLDDATGNVYKRVSGSYTLVASIKGANGTNGSNGTNGANGAQGPQGPMGTNAPPVTLIDGATINTDTSQSNHFRVTLAGNRTLANPTNPSDGQKVVWEIIQDPTGSRTLTLGSAFAFGAGITGLTLSTTASKRDFMGATYHAGLSKWFIIALEKGY